MRGNRMSFVCALAAALGAPAFADQVLTVANHTDAFSMMGQTEPAKDETHRYWFGEQAIRYDAGDSSFIVNLANKKMYMVNHPDKDYSTIDLPVDFKKLVGPEMAPMMDQMAAMMNATVKVTPTDRTGSYAGVACSWSKVEISMTMMQMVQDSCLSKDLPIDYSRYDELAASQAELMMNTKWMKELAEKLDGFPVRTDSTTTIMGKPMKNAPMRIGMTVAVVCLRDGGSNQGFASTTVTKDLSPPVVTIVGATPNPTPSSTVVSWTADQDGTYSVRVGGSSCTGGTQIASGSYTAATTVNTPITAAQLPNTSNTVRVCVTDPASNSGSATTVVVRDTNAPLVTLVLLWERDA